jgi:bifunctional non-homologous end joining protein LigD
VSEGRLSVEEQLARGKSDARIHESKLCAAFTLLRRGQRSTNRQQAKPWLLVTHRNEYAVRSWNIEAPALNRSVLTGRTMREIAEGRLRKACDRIDIFKRTPHSG